jgi:hypothetical protein
MARVKTIPIKPLAAGKEVPVKSPEGSFKAQTTFAASEPNA